MLHDVRMVELLIARMIADIHNCIVFIVVTFIAVTLLICGAKIRLLSDICKYFA